MILFVWFKENGKERFGIMCEDKVYCEDRAFTVDELGDFIETYKPCDKDIADAMGFGWNYKG